MIAVLVIVALAVSAQVQAFPGSDPVAELMAVAAPEHMKSLLAVRAPDVVCLMKYYNEAKALYDEAPDLKAAVQASLAELVQNISACRDDADKFVCGCQAIRDAWEHSASSRDELVDFGQKLFSLVVEVKDNCFSS